MKPLGQETEVLNFFKALKGTRFIHGLSMELLHFDLLVTYNFGRKSMPDSQSVLLVELYSIKIFYLDLVPQVKGKLVFSQCAQ